MGKAIDILFKSASLTQEQKDSKSDGSKIGAAAGVATSIGFSNIPVIKNHLKDIRKFEYRSMRSGGANSDVAKKYIKSKSRLTVAGDIALSGAGGAVLGRAASGRDKDEKK